MSSFEGYVSTIEMVASAIDGDEKAMRDTIEHLTGERPDDDVSRGDLREAVSEAIYEWPLSVERDGTALEVLLTVGGPGVYLIREPFSWGDEMRYIEAGQPRRTYGGAAVTTILDFFREAVGPEDSDVLGF